MPSEWRKIAAEDPERFEALQDAFILQTSYEPAQQAILDKTNIDVERLNPVLREVLWSTSVQHGANGAARIFAKAMSRLGEKSLQAFDQDLIEEVYKVRQQNFASSSSRSRQAVRNRLLQEQKQAMQMLESYKAYENVG